MVDENTGTSASSRSRRVQCFHSIPLDQVSYDLIIPDAKYSDADFLPAYRWAESRIGFFPLFLAVGDEESQGMTGYTSQWRRVIATRRNEAGKIVNVLRKKGDFPNHVLFVFDADVVDQGVFTDYHPWHIVLNETMNGGEVGLQAIRMVFKKSWSRARWLLHALRQPHTVQLLAPSLDLRRASKVYVRNQKAQRKLVSMGFANVEVKRFPVVC